MKNKIKKKMVQWEERNVPECWRCQKEEKNALLLAVLVRGNKFSSVSERK